MIKRNLTAQQVQDWAFGQLSMTQHHFSLNPNATNWNRVMFTMYIYQQATQAFRSTSVDADKLLQKLNTSNKGIWGDLISMANVGLLVRDAVPTAEVVSIETA